MVEIEQLSERFNGFEERLDRLGEDVSAMAALFYSMNAPQPQYTGEYSWLHPDMAKWRQGDVNAVVEANLKAWRKTLGEMEQHEEPPEREMVCGWEALG